AFLTYLGFNSIFNQDVLQIRAYALMNVGGYVYTMIQMFEVKIPVEFARKACLTQIDSKILENDLPQFISYTCFAMLTSYLSFKIYPSFGIEYYFRKKIGQDEILLPLLKRRHILKILLKFTAFFSTVHSILFIYTSLKFIMNKNYLLVFVNLVYLFVSALSIKLTHIAFISMDNETVHEMLYFINLWIIVLFYNISLCAIGVMYILENGWYFSCLYTFVYFSVSFASFMCAWHVKNDFGKGLKEANIQSIVIDDDEGQQSSS
ncbi:9219_t:CDS:2, partial [Funneliformis caledonium]